jgi:hypothetical protein
MKRLIVWVLGLFLIFIIGCSSDSGNSRSSGSGSNPSNGGSSGASNPSGNQQSASGFESNGTTNITLPPYNESVPSGILNQLSWMGTGGQNDPRGICKECLFNMQGNMLALKGFDAYQKILLVFYRHSGTDACGQLVADYAAGRIVQVNSQGYLQVVIEGVDNNIFLYEIYDVDHGDLLVGLEFYNNEVICVDSSSDSLSACPGAPPQRLTINEMAYVCTKSETVKLREGPGKKYSILKSLISGADVKIIGGPKCADNWSWWEVETESGYRGWMSEGGDNADKYFLCPTK